MTQRYIDFATYQPGEGPRMPVRAHRASYLDRSGFDRFHPGSLIGVLVPRPVDSAAARGVAEYLWYKDHGRNPWTKVLTSFSRASEGSVLHTIFFVQRIAGTEFDLSDAVELLRDDYRVDTASGAITFRETQGRYVTGMPR